MFIALALLAEATLKALGRLGVAERRDLEEYERFSSRFSFGRVITPRFPDGRRYVLIPLPSYQLREGWANRTMMWHRLELYWTEGRGFRFLWAEQRD